MVKFLYDPGFLGPEMHDYATASYNQILDHLKFWRAHTVVKTAVLKLKKILGDLRWADHKLGQYSEVPESACVYLKPKPNQLSKCAL